MALFIQRPSVRGVSLKDCDTLRKALAEMYGVGVVDPQAPIGPANPPNLSAKLLMPAVYEVFRVVESLNDKVTALLADDELPGQHWVGEWHWAGQDDLRRLRERVIWYHKVTKEAVDKPIEEQQQVLWEFVYLPLFKGERHKQYDDPESPWITFPADFCEASRIAKNLSYAINVDEMNTGIQALLRAVAEVPGDYWDALEAATEDMRKKVKGGTLASLKYVVPLVGASALLLYWSREPQKKTS